MLHPFEFAWIFLKDTSEMHVDEMFYEASVKCITVVHQHLFCFSGDYFRCFCVCKDHHFL